MYVSILLILLANAVWRRRTTLRTLVALPRAHGASLQPQIQAEEAALKAGCSATTT